MTGQRRITPFQGQTFSLKDSSNSCPPASSISQLARIQERKEASAEYAAQETQSLILPVYENSYNIST